MIHIGANIYYWDAGDRRRPLRAALLRWALEIRRRAMADRFWYCYFDARGPHLFALFSTAAEKQASLRAFLNSEIRGFLRACPSNALNVPAIEQLHRECRGKTLCPADRGEGLAGNNSFTVFVQDAGGYPFHLGKILTAGDELWRRLEAASMWTLLQEEADLKQAALRWLAAVGTTLRRLGVRGENYWRLHASSLIPSLGSGPELAGEALSGRLLRAVGERNRNIFDSLWISGETDCEFDVDGLVSLVMSESSLTVEQRLRTLREINHTVLGQLAQPVNLQIPMVLYLWQRSLSN